MHISDLHRTRGHSISNQELLSSLIADFERFEQENPAITRPDALVISGDIAEGLPLGAEDYPDSLIGQYEEAFELLTLLSDEFFGGDHSCVIIVPGNHDVDWNTARKAFRPEPQTTGNPRGLLSAAESQYRWSWEDCRLFRLVDYDIYKRRFNHFNNMYRKFYETAALNYHIDPQNPWNLFVLDNGNIVISGFNSCVINDCFSDMGYIRPSDIANCHLEMRRIGAPGFLPIAVWHHGVGGSPPTSDYIDPKIVRQMVDVGFRLGLHGHRHDSSHSPVDLFVSTREKMAVIGAGSLCAGPTALPTGVNRRYNIIQIERGDSTGIVHVRSMNQPNIWGPGQLFESGGRSYVEIDWSESHNSTNELQPIGTPRITVTAVDQVEQLLEARQFEEASILLHDLDLPEHYSRLLLTRLYTESEDWPELIELLASPRNDDELATLVRAAEQTSQFSQATQILAEAARNNSFDQQMVRDLQQRIQARQRLGG